MVFEKEGNASSEGPKPASSTLLHTSWLSLPESHVTVGGENHSCCVVDGETECQRATCS